MDNVTQFPVDRQKEIWPWSVNATVAVGLLVTFWLGVLAGVVGVKGGLL
jgi:hypothetical protein